MRHKGVKAILVACLASVSSFSQAQLTTSLTLSATADLFNAGTPNIFEGTNPVAINVSGLTSMTFVVSTGDTISYNIGSGSNYNNADGIGSVSSLFSDGGGGISGITAPNAGFLAGVFLTSSPTTTAPTALNFISFGTSFASLAPLIQQSFFIGDGLTGNASGATQTFMVPAGATTLYLGFIDACSYSGPPSCYLDNAGSLTVTTQTAVPESSTFMFMLGGLITLAFFCRRRDIQEVHPSVA